MSQADISSSVSDRYRILKSIGAGGMGVVYLALDIQTNQTVAIKLLKPEVVATAPDLLERFKREGQALRQLNHPNIAKVLATLEDNNQHYIVMEYVSGGSLADLLKRQPRLPVDYILKVALEVADALSRAHHLKIIHRDIKPDNVLLAEDGTPRLTDFGLAHIDESTVTQSGVVMGTYPYLSPEAFNGKMLDARADIWAFGVMLFEMLAGQRPFAGDTLAAIMYAILTKPTPDLESIRPDAPTGLVDLIYRMLEKNPDERIATSRLVGAALESIIRGVDTPLHPVTPLSIVIEDPDLTVQITTPLSSKRSNLPAQTTPFVGREDELDELAKLLSNPAIRLITILGPGGMGKTRLSLETAEREIGHFPDGVYLVELAPLSMSEHIITAIAGAIGVKFAPGSDPKQQLLNAFHSRKMLLVMDNFEHLLNAAEIVKEILQATPNIKILVTSRERLNLNSETLFILSGMDFPDWETPEDARNYGAVKLFIQSASRAKPNFALSADDLKFLARLCRLVGGIPLAIVLTAAWVSMLSLEEIADELAKGLDFLETDMSDIPERQRSIRGVFENSYHRLTPDEQSVFRKSSVFRGGFTREAAQGAAGASLKTLMALMNKSMLRRDAAGRYQIHELLRQYAEQQLIDAGELPAVQEAHATYFAHFLSERWQDWKGHRQLTALAEIEAEFENIRIAWRWLVENRRERELGEAASSLRFYLDVYSRYQEGADLFDYAVETLRSVSSSSPEQWVIGHLLGCLAFFQGVLGLFEQHKANLGEALATLRGTDHLEETIIALCDLAGRSSMYGEFEETYKAGEEAYRLAQESNNAWATRLALATRAAGLYFSEKNVSEASKILGELLKFSFSESDWWLFAAIMDTSTYIALTEHDFQELEMLCRQALQVYEMLHDSNHISTACTRLGASLAHQGREVEAKPYFRRGIKAVYDLGVPRETLIRILTTIEEYFLQMDKPFAVELLAMILSNPICDSVIAGWTEKTIVVLTAELSAEDYNAAWKRGSTWSLEQAVALVLERLS